MCDKLSNQRFLVDSGADLSLLPASADDKRRGRCGPPLIAANGSSIPSYGSKTLTLHLFNRHFTWTFLLADVSTAILGADFLRANALLVDLRRRCLVDGSDLSILPGYTSNRRLDRVFRVSPPSRFQQMLLDRPALTTPVFKTDVPRHGVQLHIPTEGPPVFARPRRLAPDKLEIAKEEFRKMEELGIIQRSESQWASPLHMVSKNDGSFRPCGDFRRLNAVTTPDRYPIPFLADCNGFLHGKRIFSKIDLLKGYHQIPVAAKDVKKTAVATPFGLFEFKRVPFGLRNAA